MEGIALQVSIPEKEFIILNQIAEIEKNLYQKLHQPLS